MNDLELVQYHLKKMADAIKCLLDNGFIEAALMLTYSGIDQMSWLNIENIESNGSDFEMWSDKYLFPNKNLGCSSHDLWAARCAMIHTATSESRGTRSTSDPAKQIYYLSGATHATFNDNGNEKVICIRYIDLISAFIFASLSFIDDLKLDTRRLAIAARKAERILAFRSIE